MKKLLTVFCTFTLFLSGCATINERGENYKKQLTTKSLATVEERANILAKVRTLPNPDKTQPTWLFIREFDNIFTSSKETTKDYLNVNSVRRVKNVAFGDVRVISPKENYSDITYRVFCQKGYIRKYSVKSYNKDNSRRPNILTLNPKDDYDEPIADNEIELAKNICVLAGFYEGMAE